MAGIDQLHFPFSVVRFAVGQYPDVGSDTGVVEQVERQGNNGLQPIVFDDPATDITFTLSGIAGKQG